MNIWEKAGLLNNGREHPNFSNGTITAMATGALVKIPFKYELRSTDYQTTSGIIPIEHVLPTVTIYTYQFWKPFTKGARLQLQDMAGTMLINSVELDTDPVKAQFSGNGTKGLIITLIGG